MTTDTSELGLEALIVRDMTSKAGGWIAGTSARLQPRILRRPEAAHVPSYGLRSLKCRRGWTSTRTPRQGASSCHACRERSLREARLMS